MSKIASKAVRGLKTALRTLPLLAFVGVIYFTMPAHTRSTTERLELWLLLLLLAALSVAAWVRRSPKSEH